MRERQHLSQNLWEISGTTDWSQGSLNEGLLSPQFISRKEGKGKMFPSRCLVTPPGALNNDSGDTGRLRGSFSKTNINCTQASEKNTMLRFPQGGKPLASLKQAPQTSKGRLSGTWIPKRSQISLSCHREKTPPNPLGQGNRTNKLLNKTETFSFYLLLGSLWIERSVPW